MAIRKVANVWIIDSVGKIGTQPSTGRGESKIAAVGFLSLDTTALVQIAMADNTSNIIFNFTTVLPTSHLPCYVLSSLSPDFYADELQVITVTQGTAWLYLG